MCGIAGYVGKGSKDTLRAMCDAMAHRGPDGDGYWVGERAGLGHRRLSIIDLAGGGQPMCNEDGTVWIAFNGEIYNYEDLRSHLVERGHRFSTNSDTEAIVHLYEEYGETCVERLRGMFAFGIWDETAGRLFCARDRLGIKPLHYCETAEAFLFASEIKALSEPGLVSRALSPSAVYKYLAFRYVPGPETIYADVQRLQPGHTLTYADGQVTLRRYWTIDDVEPSGMSEEEALEAVSASLSESIAMRLMAEVPLGLYLSGGIDSSLIAALMAEMLDRPVETLSVTFADARHDESDFSKLVAERFNTVHHTLQAAPDSLDVVSKALWHLDEPLADAAAIPVYQIAEVTKPHVTVVLSGEGADECFAGYPHFKLYHRLLSRSRLLPTWLFDRIGGILPAGSLSARTCAAMATCKDPARFILEFVSVFDRKQRRALCGPALLDMADDYEEELAEFVSDRMGRNGSRFEKFMKFHLNVWLPDDLLLKNDRMTMAHGVEARVPYLDHKFVELAFSLPDALKVRGAIDKYALRQMARGLLPAQIVNRRKKGFTVPLEEWLAADGGSRHQRLDEPLKDSGLVNVEAWERTLAQPVNNLFARRQTRTLWFFKRWHELQYG